MVALTVDGVTIHHIDRSTHMLSTKIQIRIHVACYFALAVLALLSVV
jgi:hypothetical protein